MVELRAIEDAFALKADLHQKVIAGMADDLALENAALLVIADLFAQQAFHVATGDFRAQCVGDHGLRLFVIKVQRCDQILIYH